MQEKLYSNSSDLGELNATMLFRGLEVIQTGVD